MYERNNGKWKRGDDGTIIVQSSEDKFILIKPVAGTNKGICYWFKNGKCRRLKPIVLVREIITPWRK